MRISTRDIRHQRRNAGNRTATLDHNGHPKRWYCTTTSAKTAIPILIEVYGKSSYGDDPKTDNRFNPSTSPEDNQPVIKGGGTKNTMTILVETHSDLQALAPNCHSQHATRAGFLDP